MTEYRWFRSLSTGKVGKYPAHFVSRPSLVEIDGDSAECIDCLVPTQADEVEAEVPDEIVWDDDTTEDEED